jgi:ribonuclease HI
MLSIYTDGSSINNGRKNSRGAYSAVYPHAPDLSFGRPLADDNSQTNQTAELTGILEGIRTLKSFRSPAGVVVRICTDSEYSINCLTKWVSGWRKRDWKTSEGKPVVHRVLLEEILKEIQSGKFTQQWVKEYKGGLKNYNRLLKQGENHQIEKTGERLRGLMPWMPKRNIGGVQGAYAN